MPTSTIDTTAALRAQAAAALAERLADPYLASDLSAQFGCDDLDAITALLTAHQHHAAAMVWLNVHRSSDEPGDRHYTPTK